MAGVITTTTLSDLFTEEIGRVLPSARATHMFWPGAPGHSILRVADLTNKQGVSHDFNKRGTLTAYDVTEGEDFSTVQDVSVTSTNVEATEKQVVTWVSDKSLRAVQSPNDARAIMADEAREHIAAHADKLDTDIFTLFASLDEGLADSGNAMTVSDAKDTVGDMVAANAPKPWVGFLSEVQWQDLATEGSSALADASISGPDIGGELWQNFIVKQFLGVSWFVTTSIYNDGTDDYGAVLSPRAIGLVLDKLPVEPTMEYDQSRRATEISTVASYGVGIIESDMGLYIQTAYS